MVLFYSSVGLDAHCWTCRSSRASRLTGLKPPVPDGGLWPSPGHYDVLFVIATPFISIDYRFNSTIARSAWFTLVPVFQSVVWGDGGRARLLCAVEGAPAPRRPPPPLDAAAAADAAQPPPHAPYTWRYHGKEIPSKNLWVTPTHVTANKRVSRAGFSHGACRYDRERYSRSFCHVKVENKRNTYNILGGGATYQRLRVLLTRDFVPHIIASPRYRALWIAFHRFWNRKLKKNVGIHRHAAVLSRLVAP
ncbi:hypothetical protein EVAR_57799_1 [Eumeta japonica]|uniref:Uncharacterized protein n=1 Tax=Eumeta variegata TaxID=151549 RepID=A0A4C1Y480_EUMVA|nr:hypothetical protein EVAR_57799_1 [Eumeta japonica]